MINITWSDIPAIWFIGGIIHAFYLGAIKKMEGDFLTVFFVWIWLWPFAVLARLTRRVLNFFKKLRYASNNKNSSTGD